MNIYLREIKANIKSLIMWTVSTILLIAIGIGKFVAMSGSEVTFSDMILKMPKFLRMFFGYGLFDLNTAMGFYAIMFTYIALILTIYATLLGSTIIAKEERDHTYEFLMVKPVSRTKVLTSKVLAGLTNMVLINFLTLLFSVIILMSFDNDQAVLGDTVKLLAGILMLQLLFFSIGIAISCFRNNPKNAVSITTGILLFMFILSVIIDMSDNLNFLKIFTFFAFFNALTILINNQFIFLYIIITLVISITLIFGSYYFYQKRDLGC